MAGAISRLNRSNPMPGRAGLTEPRWVKNLLITVALIYLAFFLLIPLGSVFYEGFHKGIKVYFESITEPMALSAIKLTLLVTAIVVPLNVIFGLVASWAVTRFNFRGKTLLITLIDLPFSVSPVISGMIFVLLFGSHGVFGSWFIDHDIKIIFALPGIILATWFVTFPFVARELIPLMQAQGVDEELAGYVLGASGWQIFKRITLPNIKWGLMYGVILCIARAMGEFGAVSVVSGHIRGQTNTIPLHVEILYNEYNFAGAFAVASILAFLSIITLIVKNIIEKKAHSSSSASADPAS